MRVLYVLSLLIAVVSSQSYDISDLTRIRQDNFTRISQQLDNKEFSWVRLGSNFQSNDVISWIVIKPESAQFHSWIVDKHFFYKWVNNNEVDETDLDALHEVYTGGQIVAEAKYVFGTSPQINFTSSTEFYVIVRNLGPSATFITQYSWTPVSPPPPISPLWALGICVFILLTFIALYFVSRCFLCSCSCRRVYDREQLMAPNESRVPLYVYVGPPKLRLRHFYYHIMHPIISIFGSKPCFGWVVHYANTHDILWIWSPFYNETHPLGWRIFSTFIFILWCWVSQYYSSYVLGNFVEKYEDKKSTVALFRAGEVKAGFLSILLVDVSMTLFKQAHKPILRQLTWIPRHMIGGTHPSALVRRLGQLVTLSIAMLVLGFIGSVFSLIFIEYNNKTEELASICGSIILSIFTRSVFPGLIITSLLYYIKGAYGRDIDLTSDRVYYPMGKPPCDDPFCANNPYYGRKIHRLAGRVIEEPVPNYEGVYNVPQQPPNWYSQIVTSPPNEQLHRPPFVRQ